MPQLKECKHERVEAGIKFATGKRYSRCIECHKTWHDNCKKAKEYDKKIVR
jgi:multimeric flavodoxin WrbA